jgi:hypothetical protein
MTAQRRRRPRRNIVEDPKLPSKDATKPSWIFELTKLT